MRPEAEVARYVPHNRYRPQALPNLNGSCRPVLTHQRQAGILVRVSQYARFSSDSPNGVRVPNSPWIADPSGTTATTFHAFDATDRRFFVRARIDTYTDHLTFRIATRIPSTGEKSAVAPDELFDAMMTHFGRQVGGYPAAIRGIWDRSDPDFATNLDRFNAALAAGDDEPTAAMKTFTGRMAARYNYTTVVFGVTDPPTGPPYSKANVYFKTPA